MAVMAAERSFASVLPIGGNSLSVLAAEDDVLPVIAAEGAWEPVRRAVCTCSQNMTRPKSSMARAAIQKHGRQRPPFAAKVPRYRPKAPGATKMPRPFPRQLLQESSAITPMPPPIWNRALPIPSMMGWVNAPMIVHKTPSAAVQGARENALKTGRDAQRWADRGLVRDAGTVWAEIGNLSDAKASRIMPRGIWRANAQKL